MSKGERGFTLVEVVIAASLMLVVLTATLNALDRTTQVQRRNEKVNDAQDRVRTSLESIAAQLRNLASPSTATVKTIDKATSYDFIFQTTDPNKQWVRYCLADGTNSPSTFSGFVPATASNEVLWYQTPNNTFLNLSPQQSPSQVSGGAMVATCPVPPASSGAGWATATVISSHVTNKVGGQDRPVFSFNGSPSTDTSTVTYVRSDLFGRFATAVNNARETRLSTGEYLRNQNQAPTASISSTQGRGGNPRAYTFNGTGSSDPEQRTLASFLWYKGTPQASATGTAANLPTCADSAHQTLTTGGQTWTCIGSGALLNYTFLATDGQGSENQRIAVALKVTDPGGLSGYATVNGLPLT